MKYASIDRETAEVLAESLEFSILNKKQSIAKIEKLQLTELSVMLRRYEQKQLKELEALQSNLMKFARSVDFDKYKKQFDASLNQLVDYQSLIHSLEKDINFFKSRLREQTLRAAAADIHSGVAA